MRGLSKQTTIDSELHRWDGASWLIPRKCGQQSVRTNWTRKKRFCWNLLAEKAQNKDQILIMPGSKTLNAIKFWWGSAFLLLHLRLMNTWTKYKSTYTNCLS